MKKSERDRYEKTLQEKKKEIIEKMSELVNESKEVESDTAQDLVDKAESSYTKELLLSLSDSERKQLFLIDEAVKRIASGSFGICQSCGKGVGDKRLQAIPWTPYCIECQQKMEEESS